MSDERAGGTDESVNGADASDVGTADTMRERAGESRLKLWLLLRANRMLVTAVLTVAVFVGFVVAVHVLDPPFARQLERSNTIEAMFGTMILVVVTGSTFVVTIGQLVLSQENGPLGDQRQRMSDSMDVRAFAAELTGSPSPSDPAEFLGEIVASAAERAEDLRASVAESGDEDFRAEVDAFADSVVDNAETVRDQLEGAQFGSFDVLFAALNFNYSWKIHEVERIGHEYDAQLSEADRGSLEELKTSLSLFGPAREHVKTLYFQWALIELSQLILYSAVPALAVGGVVLAVFDAGTFPGSTLGIDHVVLAVGAAFAVTLVPFLLFVAYLLRILTVAKRTLAIEPLILRETQE